jgi:hypothetical protein
VCLLHYPQAFMLKISRHFSSGTVATADTSVQNESGIGHLRGPRLPLEPR